MGRSEDQGHSVGASVAVGAGMFLRSTIRRKDGKEHRYWSVVEAKRVAGGRVVQRPVLYLGEINSSQELAWRKSIEVLEADRRGRARWRCFPRTAAKGCCPTPRDRVAKERAMRRRQLKWLCARLKQLAAMQVKREELLMKLGAARAKAPTAWRLVEVKVAARGASFTWRLDRDKLRGARRREGRYLLRTNLAEEDPAKLWTYYLQLVAVEEAFKNLKGKNLKGDLAIRPIFHQREARIEAHIFVAFLAYALHVTLKRRLAALAPGLTPRSALEKFSAVQMIDVIVPTTDGRELQLTRTTQPEPDLKLLLDKLRLELPAQPSPRITIAAPPAPAPV